MYDTILLHFPHNNWLDNKCVRFEVSGSLRYHELNELNSFNTTDEPPARLTNMGEHAMSNPISIVLTLREGARSPSVIQKVKEAAAAIGLSPSSDGEATVCCRISEDVFKNLFGKSAAKLKPQSVSDMDNGTPAGYAAAELTIDDSLKEWVEGVSVLPPAIRMSSSL